MSKHILSAISAITLATGNHFVIKELLFFIYGKKRINNRLKL